MKTKYKALIFLAVLAITTIVVTKCKTTNTNNINTEVNTSDLKRYLLDSIQSSFNERLINSNDSISKIYGFKIELQKTKVKQLKNSLEEQKNISDSLESLIPKSDTICLQAIASKQAEIDTLTAICDTLEAEAINYSKRLYLCENNANLLNSTISLKQSDLNIANQSIAKLKISNKRNWFERNAIWIGIITGGVGTAILIK